MVSKYRNTTGIIFRLFNAKDADRVIHMVSDEGQRMALMVPGVRKGTSRKSHAIDLLNTVSVKLAHNGGLESVTEAQLIDSHSQYKHEYASLMFVELVCEIISLFLQEEQDEIGYYRNVANLLDVQAPHKLALLAAALIERFLYLNGTLPRFSEDVATGEEIPAGVPIYATNDVGYTTRQELAVGEKIPLRIFKTQKFILQYDFAQINRVDLSLAEQIQLLDLNVLWLELATDRQLKCIEMFKQSLQVL